MDRHMFCVSIVFNIASYNVVLSSGVLHGDGLFYPVGFFPL